MPGSGAAVPAADVDAAVARFGELVEELVSRPRHRLPLIHRGRRSSRRPAEGPALPPVLASAVRVPPDGQYDLAGDSARRARAGLAGKANKEQE